jgi:myosin-crossreactive antigen
MINSQILKKGYLIMNNYQRIHSRKPAGIENKRAFLIGSGIASLAAAEYLTRDGYMKGSHITIFEESGLTGGALDGTKKFPRFIRVSTIFALLQQLLKQ